MNTSVGDEDVFMVTKKALRGPSPAKPSGGPKAQKKPSSK
jgi:hypothetical protein